jgi:DeoR family fructose operon transcriptional repressor
VKKTFDLMPAERQNRILEILHEKGSVRVASLSEEFDVSEITIRRDLDHLEGQHLLERTHGGAVQSRHMRVEPLYTEKYWEELEAKQRIGEAAAALVGAGEALFINSGSTTLQIFQHLGGKGVRVTTSNAGAVAECQDLDVDLLLTGGSYRRQSHSFVGPIARQALRQLCASRTFIGVDGISLKYGLTTPSLEEAEVARAMIDHTNGDVVIVADHTKAGRVADCITAPLDKVDVIVTDAAFDLDYRKQLEEQGIRVIIAN